MVCTRSGGECEGDDIPPTVSDVCRIVKSHWEPLTCKSLDYASGSIGGNCNRLGCENRNHAAACDFWALLGSRDGAASPRKAASCAAVRYSKTLRCCCFNVATTVIMFATKRAPSSLCVPKLPLRHSTPGRSALSAVVFVGSTPSTCTKAHNASRRCNISWQVPSVLAPPH